MKTFLIYVFQYNAYYNVKNSLLAIKNVISGIHATKKLEIEKRHLYCFYIQNIWNKVEKSLDLSLFIIIILFLQ